MTPTFRQLVFVLACVLALWQSGTVADEAVAQDGKPKRDAKPECFELAGLDLKPRDVQFESRKTPIGWYEIDAVGNLWIGDSNGDLIRYDGRTWSVAVGSIGRLDPVLLLADENSTVVGWLSAEAEPSFMLLAKGEDERRYDSLTELISKHTKLFVSLLEANGGYVHARWGYSAAVDSDGRVWVTSMRKRRIKSPPSVLVDGEWRVVEPTRHDTTVSNFALRHCDRLVPLSEGGWVFLGLSRPMLDNSTMSVLLRWEGDAGLVFRDGPEYAGTSPWLRDADNTLWMSRNVRIGHAFSHAATALSGLEARKVNEGRPVAIDGRERVWLDNGSTFELLDGDSIVGCLKPNPDWRTVGLFCLPGDKVAVWANNTIHLLQVDKAGNIRGRAVLTPKGIEGTLRSSDPFHRLIRFDVSKKGFVAALSTERRGEQDDYFINITSIADW